MSLMVADDAGRPKLDVAVRIDDISLATADDIQAVLSQLNEYSEEAFLLGRFLREETRTLARGQIQMAYEDEVEDDLDDGEIPPELLPMVIGELNDGRATFRSGKMGGLWMKTNAVPSSDDDEDRFSLMSDGVRVIEGDVPAKIVDLHRQVMSRVGESTKKGIVLQAFVHQHFAISLAMISDAFNISPEELSDLIDELNGEIAEDGAKIFVRNGLGVLGLAENGFTLVTNGKLIRDFPQQSVYLAKLAKTLDRPVVDLGFAEGEDDDVEDEVPVAAGKNGSGGGNGNGHVIGAAGVAELRGVETVARVASVPEELEKESMRIAQEARRLDAERDRRADEARRAAVQQARMVRKEADKAVLGRVASVQRKPVREGGEAYFGVRDKVALEALRRGMKVSVVKPGYRYDTDLDGRLCVPLIEPNSGIAVDNFPQGYSGLSTALCCDWNDVVVRMLDTFAYAKVPGSCVHALRKEEVEERLAELRS